MPIPFRVGLVLLGLLSLGDLAAPLLTDGQTPPMFIALIGSALGLLSLILVVPAWRGRVAAAIGLLVGVGCVLAGLRQPALVGAR